MNTDTATPTIATTAATAAAAAIPTWAPAPEAEPATAHLTRCTPEALRIAPAGAPLSLSVYQADERSFNVASTLVCGQREAVLVDAQFTRSHAHRLVANILASGRRLTAVYISHGDPDFYFGLDVVRQAFPGVPVFASRQTVDHIRATGTQKVAAWGPLLGNDGPGNIVLPQPLPEPVLHLEGERLEIVGLDGPMPTHSCVWVPALRALVGGVLAYCDVHGFMADVQKREERDAWRAALDRLAALQPRWVVPTHSLPGSPVDLRALRFAGDYLVAFEEELPRAADAAALVAALRRRFPRAGVDIALEIGAKVLKGGMAW